MRTKISSDKYHRRRKRKLMFEEDIDAECVKNASNETNDEELSWREYNRNDTLPTHRALQGKQDTSHDLCGDFDQFPRAVPPQVTPLSEPENRRTYEGGRIIGSMTLDELVLLYAKYKGECIPEYLVAHVMFLILDFIRKVEVYKETTCGSQIYFHLEEGTWSCNFSEKSENQKESGKLSQRIISSAIWLLMGIRCNDDNCSILIPFVTSNIYYTVKWEYVFTLTMEGNFEGAIKSLGFIDVKRAEVILESLMLYKMDGGAQVLLDKSCYIDDHLNCIRYDNSRTSREDKIATQQSSCAKDQLTGSVTSKKGHEWIMMAEKFTKNNDTGEKRSKSHNLSSHANEIQDKGALSRDPGHIDLHGDIIRSPKFVRYGRIVIPLNDSEDSD